MDSTTLLHYMLAGAPNELDKPVYALSFNYGQRHKRELECAIKECAKLSIPHQIIDLAVLQPLLRGSALTDQAAVPMPEGVYDGENMRKTVVPGRNTLMLSIAMAFAEGLVLSQGGAACVYYGAHSGDHHIYPDCRPEYIHAMAATFSRATGGKVDLFVPFMYVNKTDILKQGLELGVDYSNTWTCYKGGQEACGVCGSCDERLESFHLNGVEDPVPYSSKGRWAADPQLPCDELVDPPA
jgi:7-cyano-7-deazaguanine synthase